MHSLTYAGVLWWQDHESCRLDQEDCELLNAGNSLLSALVKLDADVVEWATLLVVSMNETLAHAELSNEVLALLDKVTKDLVQLVGKKKGLPKAILQEAGGKIIHYHGEADNSIPTLSSVIYWEQVRLVLYPNATFEDSIKSLSDFYRLYIVPGAAHCSPSAENGPFPQSVLGSVIDWVENGVVPTQLNATILQGDLEGTRQDICSFPYRPQWSSNSTESHSCVMPDQDALGTWFPVLDSTPINPYGDI